MGTWSLGEVLGMAVILAIIGVESDSWGYVHGHAVALLFPQATQMTCASIWKAEAPSLLSLWFHGVSLTSPRILLTTVSAPLASTSINSNSNVTQRSPWKHSLLCCAPSRLEVVIHGSRQSILCQAACAFAAGCHLQKRPEVDASHPEPRRWRLGSWLPILV